jgi:hypothetical protein
MVNHEPLIIVKVPPKKIPMSKQTSGIEWHIVENDADWDRLCAMPGPITQDHPSAQHFLGGVAIFLFLLVSAGGWWWHITRVTSPQSGAELRATAQLNLRAAAQGNDRLASSRTGDPTDRDWWLQHEQAFSSLHAAAIQTNERDAYLEATLPNVNSQGNQAVTRVDAIPNRAAAAYQQPRLDRHTDESWRRPQMATSLWDSERSLETPSFVFHFRLHDAPAVIAAAPQLDALATTMRRNFGVPSSFAGEKLVIDVSMMISPGAVAFRSRPDDRISVASPALYNAPVELTDADLLAQSIVLPLLNEVIARASEHHAIRVAWRPMLDGLRLWQVWDLDLPLSVWRDDVVKWIYADRPAQLAVLPAHYTALCGAHKLWMPSPTQLNIPLLCANLDLEIYYFSAWSTRAPLIRVAQFNLPVRPDVSVEWSSGALIHHPGQTVALATLIEYAVATYGYDHLPALVASLGRYDSWETLLPAVYGVSASEFEAGWQAHLAAHYGVPSRH